MIAALRFDCRNCRGFYAGTLHCFNMKNFSLRGKGAVLQAVFQMGAKIMTTAYAAMSEAQADGLKRKSVYLIDNIVAERSSHFIRIRVIEA